MTVQLTAGTPLVEQLSAAVQQKIVEIGWSSDGEDASPLSEYIVLMLVNGKTEQQITSELSGDLLGLGPEDESVKLFTGWMFDELQRLSKQNGGADSGQNGQTAEDESSRQDDEMGDDNNEAPLDGVPTGPKAMRNNQGKGRRPGALFNQLNKNMDRTGDPLRRVNNRNNDPSRIHKNDQNRGPRQNFNGPNGPHNQRHMGRGAPHQHMQNAFMNPAMGQQPMPGNQFNPLMMTPDQQLQFFQMMEQQARMMGASGMMGSNGMMGMPGPGGFPQQQGPPGRSLFDRVENAPNSSGSSKFKTGGTDTDMSEGGEHMNGESNKGTDEVACKFGLGCTKTDCPFAHPSPASDPARPVSFIPGEKCTFGINCKNKKCTSSHPSPASGGIAPKPTFQQQDCKFWPNCKNPACPFKHPENTTLPPCKFGSNCTRPNCPFQHSPATLDVPCKFKPCLNPHCTYKHEEGQQQGVFEHKIWTPGQKSHVSDRRFTTDDGDEEELIIPGQEPSNNQAAAVQHTEVMEDL